MSFKDLEDKTNPQPRVETPEQAAMREKAAAHHRAKEERRAAHAAAKQPGGAGKNEPTRR